MNTRSSYKGYLVILTLLLIVVPFIGLGQIGYKYKKWIKNKEYLVTIGSSPWGDRQIMHNFKVKGKSFTSVHYNEFTSTGKIIQILYYFPSSYAKDLYEYCSSLGYRTNQKANFSENEDLVFKNPKGTLEFRLQGYWRAIKNPKKTDKVVLIINALSSYAKFTSGFE